MHEGQLEMILRILRDIIKRRGWMADLKIIFSLILRKVFASPSSMVLPESIKKNVIRRRQERHFVLARLLGSSAPQVSMVTCAQKQLWNS